MAQSAEQNWWHGRPARVHVLIVAMPTGTPVGNPLSLWERVRVRACPLADGDPFVPSPSGRGSATPAHLRAA